MSDHFSDRTLKACAERDSNIGFFRALEINRHLEVCKMCRDKVELFEKENIQRTMKADHECKKEERGREDENWNIIIK